MAYVICEPCVDVKDGACAEVCPVDCIETNDESRQMFINPNECICCGHCESVCPVGAIYQEFEVPEKWKGAIELNARFFD